MNKTFLKIIFFMQGCFFMDTAEAQQFLSIEDIISRAKAQSPASKQAETRRENRYWSYRYYKTNFNPQLRLTGQLPYQKSVRQAPLADGTFAYAKVNQFNSFMN